MRTNVKEVKKLAEQIFGRRAFLTRAIVSAKALRWEFV